MPRFLFGAQRRSGVDVSTMDTRALPGLVPRPTVAPRTIRPITDSYLSERLISPDT
nr:hypothetical protein [Actinomyces oris]